MPRLAKHAVVLSGGGAYGAYEVGVMRALFNGESPATEKTPLNAGIFSGTSVGSYNAAFMTSQPDAHAADTVADLEHCWLNEIADSPEHCGNGVYRFRGNAASFFDADCITRHPLDPLNYAAEDAVFFARDWLSRAMAFASSSEDLGRRVVDLVDLSTIISTDPFVQMLRRTIDLDGIRRSDKLLRIATTNMDLGELRLFENDEMTDQNGHKVIMASSAVPGFFPPVVIDGKVYLDGGITMNTPLRPAVRAGADTLHVIYMDPDVRTIPVERFHSTLNVLDRVIIVTFASTINRDVELASNINEGLNLLERGDLLADDKRAQRAGARVRRGIDRVERAAARLDRVSDRLDEDIDSFIRVAGQIRDRFRAETRYKKITIHLYHPRQDLGGVLGLLNFARDKTVDLIERGYVDALEHDCIENGCTLPEGTKRPDLNLTWPTADEGD